MTAKPKLTGDDLVSAAKDLGAQVAALKAVLEVEAPRGGFQDDGQVVILFERHYFSKLTGGRFDKSHPEISNPKWGGHGKYSTQHAKLQQAVALDREAALQSASWGIPQIMGKNWASTRSKSLQGFINRMSAGEPEQLRLMVEFIQSNPGMLAALKTLDWAGFARRYNGSAYRENQYDTKLAASYRKHAQAAA